MRAADEDNELPTRYPIGLRLRETLRYGENPHQRAGLYTLAGGTGDTVVGAQLHQGKELSFNNLADADAALECVRPLPAPACVIVKHANPCGVGLGTAAAAAYEKAYATDPTSAFGGIIAFNCEVDAALATTIIERQFVEVLLATAFTPEALAVLARKPNIRVLATGTAAHQPATGAARRADRGRHAGAGQRCRCTASRCAARGQQASADHRRTCRCAARLVAGALREIQRHPVSCATRPPSASAPGR